MEYYAKKGISRQKLNMGIPLYGQSYTLKSKSNSKVNAPTKGPGRAGSYSLQPGFLTYFEICKNGNSTNIYFFHFRPNKIRS